MQLDFALDADRARGARRALDTSLAQVVATPLGCERAPLAPGELDVAVLRSRRSRRSGAGGRRSSRGGRDPRAAAARARAPTPRGTPLLDRRHPRRLRAGGRRARLRRSRERGPGQAGWPPVRGRRSWSSASWRPLAFSSSRWGRRGASKRGRRRRSPRGFSAGFLGNRRGRFSRSTLRTEAHQRASPIDPNPTRTMKPLTSIALLSAASTARNELQLPARNGVRIEGPGRERDDPPPSRPTADRAPRSRCASSSGRSVKRAAASASADRTARSSNGA